MRSVLREGMLLAVDGATLKPTCNVMRDGNSNVDEEGEKVSFRRRCEGIVLLASNARWRHSRNQTQVSRGVAKRDVVSACAFHRKDATR